MQPKLIIEADMTRRDGERVCENCAWEADQETAEDEPEEA